MNIFYITDTPLGDRSAPAIHIREVVQNLRVHGATVSLYAPQNHRFLHSLTYQVPLLWRVWRDARKQKPDVLYTRHTSLFLLPALLSKLCGIPVVLEVNGRLLEESALIDTSVVGRILLASGIFRAIESFNLHMARRVVAITPAIKKYLTETFGLDPARIVVLQNGVDIDRFSSEVSSRKELELDLQAFYVGYIGSLYSWQGVGYLLQAARLLCTKNKNARFLIMGHGEEEQVLRRYVQENNLSHCVELRPAVAHEEVARYMQALDICVCYPTAFRGGATSPFKVYEYLACGRPTVLSDIAGLREEFGDTVAYAEPENPAALAETLQMLIDSSSERQRLGREGRAFAERHSWWGVARRLLSVCTNAIA